MVIYLLSHLKQNDFLHKITTGDEKMDIVGQFKKMKMWNYLDVSSTNTAKIKIPLKKVLLYMWGNFKGVIYCEMFRPGETVNFERY